MEKQSRNFIVSCDDVGNIIQLIEPGPLPLKVGENILKYIDEASLKVFYDMLRYLKENKIALSFEIKFKIKKDIFTYQVNGYVKDEKTLLLALTHDDEINHLLQEMLLINNEQINTLRLLHQTKKPLEVDVLYDEISQLNSDLLNARRKIEKQNAELTKYNQLLENLAMRDPLTQAYNRRYFYEFTKKELSNIRKMHKKITLVAVDFNDFKIINDRFGHDKGDKLLIGFVHLVKSKLGEDALLFRLGGDEFLLLIPSYNEEEANQLMNDVDHDYSKLFTLSSLAFGILEIDTDEFDDTYNLDPYIVTADSKMYQHKRNRKKSTTT